MKKSLAYLAILAIIAGITLVYCSKKANNLEKAIPLEQPLSVTTSIDPLASYVTGTIQISTNKRGDIIVLVNGKDTARSTLFFIQGAKLNISETIDKGEVVYLMHSIIINSLEKKERYYFSVPKDEETFVYGRIPASYKSFFTEKAQGYAVVEMKGGIPEDLGIFNKEEDNYKALAAYRRRLYPVATGNTIITDLGSPGGGIGDVSCYGGGEGATTCGLDEGIYHCNASCHAGYYACCNYGFVRPVCSCVLEHN